MTPAPSKFPRSFFDFNIGHLLTILVCGAGFTYGYGALNTRVTNLESTVHELKAEWKSVGDQIGMSDRINTAQVASMNVKLAGIENDLAWVKKNMK